MLAAKIGHFRAKGFDPRSISGLLGWWDASDSASVTLSGGFVSEWRDISGSGLHVSQSVEANRPGVATVNGRQAIDFDGTNDFLQRVGFSGSVGTVLTAHVLDVTNVGQMLYDMLRAATPSGFYGVGMLFSSTNEYRTRAFSGGTQFYNSGVSGSAGAARITAHTFSGSATAATVSRVAMTGTTSTTFGNQANIIFGSRNISNAYSLPLDGRLCEIIAYDRVLSATEIASAELYLATKWGVTLPPEVSNADAQSWIDRVYANGGTVSTTTATAVNDFCAAIDAAGLRDRFYRLNLFAGTGLAAALVPLYRGQSLGGTQFGNATDTNVNFAAGDYVETGSTGGLKGNGSNKHLLTGFLPSDTGAGLHMAVALQSDINLNSFAIGCDNAFDAGWTACNMDFPSFPPPGGGTSALRARCALSSNGGSVGQSALTESSAFRFLCSSPRTTGSAQVMYENGVQTQSLVPTYQTHPAFGLAVFGGNRKGTVVARTTARLSSYSAGLDMTGTQAAAYNSALVAFLTALGRNV